ncbi:phosphotransferase enzyme family protein [Streptomyces sp. NPDC088337]|uniref:phosphotransferase enzyme family protein n=1 Tax=unclassified Streptomyces TaxID=2593676 RepID=UPI002DDC36C5|nr:aminoglycoside phosphotransferase family protein [Streptomyces sp. NBC_01788]WSB25245.1 aminoglycoside phosphotransferase family protein [Streptomyces sp. NBC_01788]
MSTAASTYPDLPPEEVRQLAEQAVGRIATWTDASWDRDSSRVWRADGAQEGVWYVKIHQNTRFHHREVDAYRSWVPGLGTSAPTLVTSDSALLAVVITTVPGRPLDGIDHPPEQQRLLFRQIGALAAAIHGSAAPLSAEEGMPALAKVERHLEAARPYLRPGDEVFIRQIVARAEAVPPLDRVPTHGDFQLRNLLLDDDGSLAVIDFERSEPGPAIRDLVRLADAWATQPRLHDAFMSGYGRQLTPAEEERFVVDSTLDALSGIQYGATHADVETQERGHRTLARLRSQGRNERRHACLTTPSRRSQPSRVRRPETNGKSTTCTCSGGTTAKWKQAARRSK